MYDNTASYLRNGLLSQAAVRSGSYDRRKTLRTSIIIIHEHLVAYQSIMCYVPNPAVTFRRRRIIEKGTGKYRRAPN